MSSDAFWLHPASLKKAVDYASEVFAFSQVTSGNSVDWMRIWRLKGIDGVLPASKELAAYEADFVGSEPLYTFLRDTITDEVREKFAYDSEAEPRMLLSLEGYGDPRELATRLIRSFVTELPRTYMFTLPLPSRFPPLAMGSPTKVGPVVQVLPLSDEFRARYPFNGPYAYNSPLARVLMGNDWATATKGSQAIQVEVSGYVGGEGETLPLRSALSQIRTFLGLLVVAGAFDARAIWASKGTEERAFVHLREADGSWKMVRSVALDHGFSVALEVFGFHYLFDGAGVEKQTEMAQLAIKDILPAYGLTPDAAKLRLAAKWFLDGHHSDPLQAFVQTMVCLEILLGENREGESIGGALQSRCAYLLASTHADRREIEGIVAKAYKIRGKIVHTGKDTLSGDEEWCLDELRTLCKRVVRKELTLLRNAEPTDTTNSGTPKSSAATPP